MALMRVAFPKHPLRAHLEPVPREARVLVVINVRAIQCRMEKEKSIPVPRGARVEFHVELTMRDQSVVP